MNDRNETIQRIKTALLRRSGKQWSVTGRLPAYWDRFWGYVTFEEGDKCWIWNGSRSGGYARFKLNNKSLKAHRIVYEMLCGVIPSGLCVMHSCDNPACVNPAHLSVGTNHDNVMDSVRKGRRAMQDPRPAHRNGTSILTWNDVDEIRRKLTFGITQQSLSNRFNIAQSSVSRIARFAVWKEEHRG